MKNYLMTIKRSPTAESETVVDTTDSLINFLLIEKY